MLTSDEFHRVYQAAPAWLKTMMLCAYHTGMHEGEVRLLRWHPPQPRIDKPAQNRYKIDWLPLRVRQSSETGRMVSPP